MLRDILGKFLFICNISKGMKVRAIITDFDGTLVDTYRANFLAYNQAFLMCGLSITEDQYRECFGLRFDSFMHQMGVDDDIIKAEIRRQKKRLYPENFDLLVPNESLIAFIRKAKQSGVKTAIASTAQQENLMNVLNYLQLTDLFDEIIAGASVKKGKPDPEIYLRAMEVLYVNPKETLIFEDSEVGLLAAEASGANYIKVTDVFFNQK